MSPVVDAALPGCVVLLAGLVASAALRGRSPALRHAVLALSIALAGAALPMRLALPGVPVPLPSFGTGVVEGGGDGAGGPATPAVSAPSAAAAARPAVLATVPADRAAWPATRFAGIVWAAGALFGLALLAAACARLRRLTAAGTPIADAGWQAIAARLAAVHGWRAPVRIVAVARPDLVATWGWRRPVVLVPAAALDWDTPRIEAVLAHELAHVARGDWIVQLAAEAVRASLWWNPLAWLACRRLRDESERACDDAVLGAGLDARSYAAQLIAIARTGCHQPTWTTAMAMARSSTLERRIVAMLNPRLDRAVPSPMARLTAALCLLALTVSVTVLRAAQGAQPLEGVLYDVTGAVLPGVVVTLGSGDTRTEATTDAAGRFLFPAVDPGRHVLEARLPGFRLLREEIELREARDWDRAITLPIGEVKETVSVFASRGNGAAVTAAPAPVRVGGNIRPPRKLRDVAPVYPQSMRDAGREGVVRLEAIIGVDGRVSAVRVTSAQIHPDFALAAVDAVRRWQFAPTLLNGTAVEVAMSVSISFDLGAE